jgi:hypothetical protein
MGLKPRRYLDHVPQDLGGFVVILFAAAVTAHRNPLGQHWKAGVRIGLAQNDLMRVREIAFVMESVVFAEYDPEVVFGHRSPPNHKTWEWALSVVCLNKFLGKVSNM